MPTFELSKLYQYLKYSQYKHYIVVPTRLLSRLLEFETQKMYANFKSAVFCEKLKNNCAQKIKKVKIKTKKVQFQRFDYPIFCKI